MKVSKNYRKTLGGYFRWLPQDGSIIFRPNFESIPDGPSADEVMLAWESNGVPLPKGCREPDLLADYVQGKTSRDFHIDMWRQDVPRMFHWSEFIGTFGLTEIECRKIFGLNETANCVYPKGYDFPKDTLY